MAGKTQAKAKAPSALPVVGVCLFSILVGIAIHVQGVHRVPAHAAQFFVWSTPQLKQHIGLAKSWPGTDYFARKAPEAERFFLVVLKLFKELADDCTGQGLVLVVGSIAAPLCSFFILEALKDGQSALINVPAVILIALLGQAMMIGAAGPIFFVSLYAYVRWGEVSRASKVVHPLPSPASWKVDLAQLCNIFALALFFPVLFLDSRHPDWIAANIAFQVFPVAWLPLLFVSRGKTAVSSRGSAAARQKPRLSAGSAYQLMSYVMVALYFAGWYLAFPGFVAAFRNDFVWATAGQHVIFWDCLGCASMLYSVVLIDSWVDEAKIAGGAPRTHNRRLILEDLLMGLPGLALFGPGWAIAKYFQRREILAEKARFGLKQA